MPRLWSMPMVNGKFNGVIHIYQRCVEVDIASSPALSGLQVSHLYPRKHRILEYVDMLICTFTLSGLALLLLQYWAHVSTAGCWIILHNFLIIQGLRPCSWCPYKEVLIPPVCTKPRYIVIILGVNNRDIDVHRVHNIRRRHLLALLLYTAKSIKTQC